MTSLALGQSDQTATDFAHDIVPILQKHCVGCHGGREAKGSFSMNTRELLVDSGNVQLGQPSDSKLIELILATDPELQMPPKDQARLSVAEVAVLKKWIADDVPWDDGFLLLRLRGIRR